MVTQNDSPEVIAAAVRKSKTKNIKDTPYNKKKSHESLKSQPVAFSTTAMNHNNKLDEQPQNIQPEEMNIMEESPLSKNASDNVEKAEEDMSLSEEKEIPVNTNDKKINEESKKYKSNNSNIVKIPANPTTEKLEFLDPSFIAGKNIRNVKKAGKRKKLEEIKENIKTNNSMTKEETSTDIINPNTKERHIKLMEYLDDYLLQDLVKEIASTKVVTKLGYLLDLFPKLRAHFNKSLKLTPKSSLNNVLTLVNKFKIIKILGKIEGVNCEIFLDTCASVNAITRSALKKFQITKQAIGKIEETIFQAYSNSSIESEIYELEVTIGTRTFKDHFRVIEKDDIFDILIGVDSLKKNRFDINLVNDTLYYIDNDYTSHKLADLFYDLNFNNTFAPLEEDEKKEEDEQKKESLLLTITI